MQVRLGACIIAALAACLGLAAGAARAATVISGADLSALDFRANGGTAAYVAGTPDVAYLQTDDSGLTGGAPIVYVKAANVGLASLGPLSGFSASYDLAGSSTPTGTAPYWLTYLIDPSGGYVGVISFGGPDFNDAAQIHVLCSYASASCTGTYFGDTLATLKSLAYGSTTFGALTVYEAGIEIGDWNNGASVIPASASIQSITVATANDVPEPPTLLLLAAGIAGLAARRQRA